MTYAGTPLRSPVDHSDAVARVAAALGAGHLRLGEVSSLSVPVLLSIIAARKGTAETGAPGTT